MSCAAPLGRAQIERTRVVAKTIEEIDTERTEREIKATPKFAARWARVIWCRYALRSSTSI